MRVGECKVGDKRAVPSKPALLRPRRRRIKRGRPLTAFANIDQAKGKKRSCIVIRNKYNIASAIITAIQRSRFKLNLPNRYHQCKNANRSAKPSSTEIHAAEAVMLMKKAGVRLPRSYSKSDLEKLQRIIPDFKINVWEPASPPEQPKLYFEGDSEADADKTIMLFLDKRRFSVITDVATFFGFAYFLPCCQKFYNSVEDAKDSWNGGLPCRKNHAEVLPTY